MGNNKLCTASVRRLDSFSGQSLLKLVNLSTTKLRAGTLETIGGMHNQFPSCGFGADGYCIADVQKGNSMPVMVYNNAYNYKSPSDARTRTIAGTENESKLPVIPNHRLIHFGMQTSISQKWSTPHPSSVKCFSNYLYY